MKVNIRHVQPLTVEKLIQWAVWNPTRSEYLAIRFGDSIILKGIVRLYNKLTSDKVVVVREDIWSADQTLAKVILPVLQRLKSDRHGNALVDDEDVPHELHMNGTTEADEEFDDLIAARWEYVLGRMIFAFTHIAEGRKYVDDYMLGIDEEGDCMYNFNLIRMEREIETGTTLFGKYFAALWD